MIKILFICSCLEPGEDGVGDYTRKLAGALINHGHEAVIAAINDRRMQDEVIWKGQQYDDNTCVEVLRLPSSLPWRLRLDEARKFTDEFNPEWISFQYVPFGFQIKGLPVNIGKKLKSISTHQRWHIMFHELSVNKDESFKFKAWAFLQVNIIKSLLRTLKPALVTTNTEIYRIRLQQMHCPATLLPLFSNITPLAGLRKPHPFNSGLGLGIRVFTGNRSDYIVSVLLFGDFSVKTWDLCSLLDKFSATYRNKRILISSIGRMASGAEYWKALGSKYPHIIFLTLGIQDADFISYWLSRYTDFGILATLPELAAKSGTFMAFKEHGIPVVCRQKSPALEPYRIELDKALNIIEDQKEFVMPAKF